MVMERRKAEILWRPKLQQDIRTNINKAHKHYLTQSILETTVDFCRETSLHGCRLILDKIDTRNVFLRRLGRLLSCTIWTTVVFLGLAFGIYLMLLVWNRFAKSPIITTIDTNNYPIWKVDFPAVTICNVNAVYKPQTYNITRTLENHGIKQSTINLFYKSLNTLVNYDFIAEEYINIFEILEKTGYNAETLMFELSHPCHKMLRYCRWLGKDVSCSSIFNPSKTAGGFCCSFNFKVPKIISKIDSNRNDLDEKDSPPLRISGAGEDAALIAVVYVEPSEYVAPKRFFYGAEVYLHDSKVFPEAALLTAFGQPGLEVSIAVTPSVVVAEKSVQAIPMNVRFCIFGHEKKLQITENYNFQSCITECRIKHIFSKCGCIPFFYPIVRINETFLDNHQCTLRHGNCLTENKYFFASLKSSISIERHPIYNTSSEGMNCDCLPSCNQEEFITETFISQRVHQPKFKNSTEALISNASLIRVYFKNLSCIKYRRELFMTWDAMLASFGGIFGLCLGGSVLSIVEILYYATFRFFTKIIKNRKSFQNQQKNYNAKNIIAINFNKKYFTPSVIDIRKRKQFLP